MSSAKPFVRELERKNHEHSAALGVLSAPTTARAYAQAILFGPGGKLYIPISGSDSSTAGQLRRCNVNTKVCDVVAPAGNPLQAPFYLIFKNSDPATLGYGGNE